MFLGIMINSYLTTQTLEESFTALKMYVKDHTNNTKSKVLYVSFV